MLATLSLTAAATFIIVANLLDPDNDDWELDLINDTISRDTIYSASATIVAFALFGSVLTIKFGGGN